MIILDRPSMAMIWIAFAGYLGLYPAMLVVPLVLMQPSSKVKGLIYIVQNRGKQQE